MSAVVVDASVAVKWIVDEDGSDAAAALLDGRPIHAPDLLYVETANALWAIHRRGAIPRDAVREGVAWLRAAPILRHADAPGLAARAAAIALDLDHPVYDCLYLAVAIDAGLPLVTADRRFLDATRRDPAFSTLTTPLATTT